MITERISKLREKMKENDVQAYIVPTSDFHETEYVCEYFACRKYMSGFTGSAGVLVVLLDKAALWTDGRYFIQAANQLEGTGIDLMKMGQPGVPEIDAYIVENLKENDTVGFDGRVMNTKDALAYKSVFDLAHLNMNVNLDLVNDVWQDRPELPSTPTFHYAEKFSGESMESKLARLRAFLKENHVDSIVLTSVDQIAWLYNLRAHDIPNFPVALAYSIVSLDSAAIYMDASRLDELSQKEFNKNNVKVCGYNDIYEDTKALENSVLIDHSSVNYAIVFKFKG